MASKERGAKGPSQIGAAAGARYQRWTAFVFALLIPVSTYRPIAPSAAPEILDFYVRPGLHLSDLAVGALLLANLSERKKRCGHWGDRRLTVPLLALVGLACVTIPAALSQTLAGYTAIRWLLAAGVYLSLVRGNLPLESWTKVFVTGLGVQALIGLGQTLHIALDIITDRPLTGVGAGNFPVAMLATDTRIIPQPVHNVPLLLAAEVGVIGGFLWIWLWLTPGLAVNPAARGQNPWPVVVVGAGFVLGIIGLWDDYPWALNAGRLCTITVLSLISRTLFSHSTSPGRAGKRH